jgi:hypothetical protein
MWQMACAQTARGMINIFELFAEHDIEQIAELIASFS